MAFYLEDYRACMDIWAARTSWATRTTWRISVGNGRVISCLGTMILCASLAVLLVIGEVEKNPGSAVEVEKCLQIVCSGCDRNLKSGTHCNTVDTGSNTHVVMLKLKWQRAENGSVISVDRRDSDC